jgi:hypothetical protein
MNTKKISITLALGVLFISQTFAQIIPFSDIRYWVGSGNDSAVLVVSFHSSDFDSSTAWGVLFDNSITGQELMEKVAMDDPNFEIKLNGQFLDSVGYHRHSGKNGVNGFYWGTYTFQDTAWESNSGLVSQIHQGGYFGVSYTNFSPVVVPGKPIPAFNPHRLSTVVFDSLGWFGSGNSHAFLVVDFSPSTVGISYAFGIRFDDSITGLEMLELVAQHDTDLQINASSFLSDLVYRQDSGMGGMPNYWGTWSGTNLGNWEMNMGISTVVKTGELFGCGYTDFMPALRPDANELVRLPVQHTSIPEFVSNASLSIFPNPFMNQLTVNIEGDKIQEVTIRDLQGRIVHNQNNGEIVNTSNWNSGIYILECKGFASVKTIKIMKQ